MLWSEFTIDPYAELLSANFEQSRCPRERTSKTCVCGRMIVTKSVAARASDDRVFMNECNDAVQATVFGRV